MSDPGSENMICPKCGQFQSKADICSSCGVVVSKLRPRSSDTEREADTPDPGGALQSPKTLPAKAPKLHFVGGLAALAIAVAVLIGIFLLFAPKDMGIDELAEAKKSSVHFRGFRVAGKVVSDSYGSFMQVQSSDGRKLPSLKLEGNNSTASVTYDPETIKLDLNKGDSVTVTGSFERIPYYDFSGKYKQMTIAVARSIKVLDSNR